MLGCKSSSSSLKLVSGVVESLLVGDDSSSWSLLAIRFVDQDVSTSFFLERDDAFDAAKEDRMIEPG